MTGLLPELPSTGQQANRPTGGLRNYSGRLNEALQTTNYRNHPAEVGEPMNLAGLLTF